MDKEGLRESYKLYRYIQETQFKMKFPALLVETCIGLNGLTLGTFNLDKETPSRENVEIKYLCPRCDCMCMLSRVEEWRILMEILRLLAIFYIPYHQLVRYAHAN